MEGDTKLCLFPFFLSKIFERTKAWLDYSRLPTYWIQQTEVSSCQPEQLCSSRDNFYFLIHLAVLQNLGV